MQLYDKSSISPSNYIAPIENAGATPPYSMFVIHHWVSHEHALTHTENIQ